jgi:predicted PurR-regulated permease PerM
VARPQPGTFVVPILLILLVLFLYSIAGILLLFLVSVLFAIFLGALTDEFQRRLGLPRQAGLLLSVLLTLIGVGLVFYMVAPPLVAQTRSLIDLMPALVESWDRQIRDLVERSPVWAQVLGPRPPDESYVGGFVAQIAGWLGDATPYVFGGVKLMIYLSSVFVMGIYLSLRPGVYREGFIQLAPPVHRELVRDILSELGQTLRAWIVGQLAGMFVLGLLTWIGLELLRVPYALAFGVLAAIITIVPFFGSLISTVLPALFVLGTGGIGHTVLVLLLGVVVNNIESNVVQPMIMERQVNLPPVLSILAVLVMATLLGVLGVFVAVPVLVVVMVILRRVYVHRILEGKGFRRAMRDRPIEVRLPRDGSVLIHPAAFEKSIPSMLES